MNQKSENKEELLAHVDGIVRMVKIVFIAILMFPFVFYVASKINFDREEIAAVVEEPLIENGIDVESGLIVDEHYELVKGTCSACHSIALVTQNSATREGWKELIVWMQKTQKLWDLGDNEALILDYLEKNYAPKKQGRRAPLKNIEWYEL
ncbi:MAG: hypothetical protein COB15_15660 [Flavobacteriales bacterium]|nr:MAG: hypothetical protein COB15_15660 [Flavobacteriales bacterium]